jgi:hypothetical protein
MDTCRCIFIFFHHKLQEFLRIIGSKTCNVYSQHRKVYLCNLSPNENGLNNTSIVHGVDSRFHFIRLEEFGNFVDRKLAIAIVFD